MFGSDDDDQENVVKGTVNIPNNLVRPRDSDDESDEELE